jgi:hypothetical protein
LQAGTYTLNHSVPGGTSFSHWECYNTTSGIASPAINGSSISLAAATSFSCVAVFGVMPRLALLSNYLGTSNYTGPASNLNATGPSTCVQAPSKQLEGSITNTNPLIGLCNGSGTMQVCVCLLPHSLLLLLLLQDVSSWLNFCSETC